MNRAILISAIALALLTGFAQAKDKDIVSVGKMTKEQLKADCAQYKGDYYDFSDGKSYSCDYPSGGIVSCDARSHECVAIFGSVTKGKNLPRHLPLDQLHKQLNE